MYILINHLSFTYHKEYNVFREKYLDKKYILFTLIQLQKMHQDALRSRFLMTESKEAKQIFPRIPKTYSIMAIKGLSLTMILT